MRNASLLASLFILVAGCSSSGTPSDTITDSGAALDGAKDGGGSGDGGCIDPVEGAACTSTDQACPPVGNICCIGYVWQCSGGAWTKLGLGCACQIDDAGADAPSDAPFACGTSTCSSTEMCTSRPPGIPTDASPPPTFYACESIPAACASTPTCDCIRANIGPNCSVTNCSVDVNGDVHVECLGV
jgi:hypothetical protein